jgi:hypothetical protein
MAAWKDLERKVAKFFNTKRRLRGSDFSESDVEIIADVSKWLDSSDYSGYIIGECKYRSTGLGVIDSFIKDRDKDRLSIGRIGSDVVMVDLKDFEEIFIKAHKIKIIHPILFQGAHVFQVKKNVPKYINEYLDQAGDYGKIVSKEITLPHGRTVPCLPLLCTAKRSRQGVYALFRIEDLQLFLKT